MAAGTVKFWNDEKGYGFIAPDGGSTGDDVFVHRTGIPGSDPERGLQKGARVTFETRPGRKNLEAFDVTVIESD